MSQNEISKPMYIYLLIVNREAKLLFRVKNNDEWINDSYYLKWNNDDDNNNGDDEDNSDKDTKIVMIMVIIGMMIVQIMI